MCPLRKVLQRIGTDWKKVEKRSEPFFNFHFGFLKVDSFCLQLSYKRNWIILISFRCFYYLKTIEPFRSGPDRKKSWKNPTFFSIRFDPNTWTIEPFTWKKYVASGSKIILRTIENVPIRTDPLQTFRSGHKPSGKINIRSAFCVYIKNEITTLFMVTAMH